MRKAIQRLFLQTHHHLCGCHMLQNATSNVSKPKFIQEFKCMLGDYEVDEFEKKWVSMVKKYWLKDNSWIEDIYQKKGYGNNTHERQVFFGSLRTTSRCEGLH